MDILLIDDNEDLLEQAEIYLKKEGINPIAVGSPRKALKLLSKENFSAVVCDYKMPEMDGLEFLKNLKEKGFDVPFIMFTGKGREEVAMNALNFGADRYLQKGGDPKVQYKVLADAIKQEAKHWKTKKKLTSTEKKYRDLAEKSLVGVYIIQDDVFRYVNPEFCRIFGYDREELLGMRYKKLVADESTEKVVEGVSRRQNNEGEPTRYEFKGLTNGDMKIDVEVFSVPSFYHGRPSVQGTLIDITEGKRKKQQLKENKRKIEKLHEIANEMRGLSDKNEVYEYTVKVAQDILDFDICSVDIVEGEMFRVRATSDETPPESSFDSPVDEGISGKTYQKKKSILIRDVDDSPDADPKNSDFRSGISVPIGDLGVFQAVAYVRGYFDEEDLRMANLLTSHTAHTLEKIENKEELENKKEKISNIHDLVFDLRECESVQDVYDKIVEFAEKVLEFDECGVIIDEGGKAVVKSASNDVPEEGKKISSMDKGIVGRTYRQQTPLLVKDIDDMDIEPKLSDYESGLNVPILDRGIFQAISKDKDDFDEEDLELSELLIAHMENTIKKIESENMKEFMITLLRHDMKNKTRITEGYLELIEKNELEEDVREIIDKAQRSCSEGLEFIDKLGVLKEIEKEKGGSKFSLDKALTSAISRIEDQLQSEDIEINYQPLEKEVIGGDLLEVLFFNLFENAVKHGNCSNIWVSIEEENSHVSVEIEDDGDGIDDDIMDEVFKRGIKGEGSSGTGIGLYIVKKITKLYGGDLEVRLTEDGGSTFIIKLKKT